MDSENEGQPSRFNTTNDAGTPVFFANAIYLARTAQINTLTLSQMADQKASILIGATFVVFSLVVTKLIGAELTLPMILLSLTAFISAFFAVLALRPISAGGASVVDTANILFFANFARIDEDAWQDRLAREFRDDEAVLRIMLRDVHQHGQVLHRTKYRFLGYAYGVVLIGLAITMLAYLAEMVFGFRPLAA